MTEKKQMTWEETGLYIAIAIGIFIIFSQYMQLSLISAAAGVRQSSGFTFFGEGVALGEKTIIGPMLNEDGRTTKLVEWPTISPYQRKAKTGDPTQDAINAVIPTGTPFYVQSGPGSELLQGVSFDDPITSQKVWAQFVGSGRFGKDKEIKLTPEEQARYDRIVGVFTCDYCCGSPQQVTRINNCGCAHSYAWKGMAKFFIKYYPNYSDEEIAGEMTKWKGLWYPQGMINDYIRYQQST
ncbi:MAG: hypothetical protein QW331_00895 [Candidatus Woesearchaeota archaeon]